MNAVAQENARPGDDRWWTGHAPPHAIEGYLDRASARPGDRLALHVATRPSTRYRTSVHRLGWYGGAGGRTLAEYPYGGGDLRGLERAAPAPGPGPQIEATGWPATDLILVGEDWATGVYIVRLTLTTGAHAGRSAFVPFVVRPPVGASGEILVQQGVTTAQAYNNWGGKSLYASNSTDQEAAVKVSFARPHPAWSAANLNARWPFAWDYQLLRFLEREGFDVAYTTDLDTHREPWSLAGHRLIMTSGHDEYWTREMRDAFDLAAADGTNLACMGANTGYWQARLEDDEQTLVEYRWRAQDPEPDRALKTELFRDLLPGRPECLLWGVQYQDGITPAGLPPRDYELTPEAASDRWLEGTGFEPPATLRGLVGYEWDAVQQGCEPSEATVFFHYEDDERSHADALRHRLASGSTVFAAGSLQFSWGLDDWGHPGHADERLQRFMRNALRELTGRV